MSVATAAPTSAVPPASRPSSHKSATPTHSILRPCDKKGCPIGPPVITAPPNPVSLANPASATVATPISSISATPISSIAATAINKAAPTAISTVPVPSSPTKSQITVSSTDSVITPSMSTGQSSPSASATSTLASSVSAASESGRSEVFDGASNHSSLTGTSTPRSSMISPSPKIRFGNCPERPPDLRRRNSITLGVLARKNMLHAQGTVPNGARGGLNKVYMTDEEWEAYQQKFSKTQTAPVDIGAVMSSGAKNFWRKVRRGSNASVTSNSSATSAASTPAGSTRARSDSASANLGGGAGSVSPRAAPVAPVIEEDEAEEDEAQPAPGSHHVFSSLDGDQTPGRRRSPSPQQSSPVEDDSMDTSGNFDCALSDSGVYHQANGQEHHGGDDTEAEYYSHRHSSAAALGFDLRDYKQRPTWGRRGSGSGRPSFETDVPHEQIPRSQVPAQQVPPQMQAPAQQVPPQMQAPAQQVPPQMQAAQQVPPQVQVPAQQVPPQVQVPQLQPQVAVQQHPRMI